MAPQKHDPEEHEWRQIVKKPYPRQKPVSRQINLERGKTLIAHFARVMESRGMHPKQLLLNIPECLTELVYRGTTHLRHKLGSLTWRPAVQFAKGMAQATFASLEVGTLLLVDQVTAEIHIHGDTLGAGPGELGNLVLYRCQSSAHDYKRKATDLPGVELVVLDDAFWLRLLLFMDMGFAESYMLGEFECDDLTSFFQMFILNRERLNNGTTWFSGLFSHISGLARVANTMDNARLNIVRHYDISNDMFAAFLSPDMMYSCPIWKHSTGCGTKQEESLEDAQMRKINYFIEAAKIKPTDHVLEIGTGWGTMAIEAVRKTGCRVTTITLSLEQKIFAEARIQEAGFSDRIAVHLMDYRLLPEREVPYDKIISCEMIEAVGEKFLATYFSRIDKLLKKDGGIAVFQCITMPEGRHKGYSKREDFINHYIFPGGYLPSITQLINHITNESKGTLIVENIKNIGPHYVKTLKLWREAFMDKFDCVIVPALKKMHPCMTAKDVKVFRRKWEYYFAYSEAGFLTKTLGDVIITVGREGALELMEGIPL
ncbi:Mycolic acid cyclopropane synthetase-domain-containing protein [Pseudoneurospora amorphoporcata]|uniref:Mycolic acid cyclopropane synthetase-domain-containing protein n=1 Tax=Pseudoneurospora amorphoporcata TaxID=241081 RepID=A0AAN6NTM1_9PEZI|nr:Mycolic acid cyclopropane synthetase-domain-containing protein [Pseudoneurospora amorphoporcata]